MALALRGWGAADFELVDPQFYEAVRWALFAEKAGAWLQVAQAEANTSIPDHLDTRGKAEYLRARLDAQKHVNELRAALHLNEESDG